MTIILWLLAITTAGAPPHVQHFLDRNRCLQTADILVTYGQAPPGTTCQRLELSLGIELLPEP